MSTCSLVTSVPPTTQNASQSAVEMHPICKCFACRCGPERPPGVDIFVVNIIQRYRVAGSETQKLFRPLTYQAAVERSSLRKWIASFADQAFDGAYRRVIRQPS
uniref:Uncharacterized protein n=1 Tax=Coccidioides posadasii RMSCC 3488 TaxID=454284 RepID=A0A0J6FS73_COCPO|nr:hypothetical protein CPAG_09507 [Coccidioides posadasii RMSCC 3488]